MNDVFWLITKDTLLGSLVTPLMFAPFILALHLLTVCAKKTKVQPIESAYNVNPPTLNTRLKTAARDPAIPIPAPTQEMATSRAVEPAKIAAVAPEQSETPAIQVVPIVEPAKTIEVKPMVHPICSDESTLRHVSSLEFDCNTSTIFSRINPPIESKYCLDTTAGNR